MRYSARVLALGGACLCLALPASAAALEQTWRFNTGDEDWITTSSDHKTEVDVEEPIYVPSNGNPGGFIAVTDDEVAPDEANALFRPMFGTISGLSENYGGTISFDVLAQGAVLDPPFVYIASPNGVLQSPRGVASDNQWTNYAIEIEIGAGPPDNKWRFLPPAPGSPHTATFAEMQSVLSTANDIGINGDLVFGVGETTGLDNVELTEGPPDADSDGVFDSEDACPNVAAPGSPDGCPDTDGDGLTDPNDDCPEQAAPGSPDGCPDGDGDGVTDPNDSCPSMWAPTRDGCPVDGELIKDGSFEQAVSFDSPHWIETDSAVGSPICDATCGIAATAAPRTGGKWAWLGGVPDAYTGSLSQSVRIPSGGTATLSFWVWYGSAGSGDGELTVGFDGDPPLARRPVAPVTAGYELVTLDATAYADGQSHSLRFALSNPTADLGPLTNVSLDDISLLHARTSADRLGPETIIDKAPPATVRLKKRKKKATVLFGFTSENGATFRCSLDGDQPVDCASPFTAKLGRGRHSFAVAATDAAGNADATPPSFSFQVKKAKRTRGGKGRS